MGTEKGNNDETWVLLHRDDFRKQIVRVMGEIIEIGRPEVDEPKAKEVR